MAYTSNGKYFFCNIYIDKKDTKRSSYNKWKNRYSSAYFYDIYSATTYISEI